MVEGICVSRVQRQGVEIVTLLVNKIVEFLVTKGSIIVGLEVFWIDIG